MAIVDLREWPGLDLRPFVRAAANGNPDRAPISLEAIDADPTLSAYAEGFGRGEDVGFGEVVDGRLVGAAWARFGMEGHGFVAHDIPELTVAVEPEHQGKGIATGLLGRLFDALADAGVESVSLAVEDGNPAVALFASLGFGSVGWLENSDVMLLRLPTAETGESD